MKMLQMSLISVLIFSGILIAQNGKSALYFDGHYDYVDCGNDSSLNLQEALTLEVWIKADPNNYQWARILDKYHHFNHQGFSLVRHPPNTSVMIDFFSTEDTKHTYGAKKPVFDMQWHYAAATFNGEVVHMYIDGNLESTDSTGQKRIQLCPHTFKIGDGWDGNMWFHYRGFIDEVRVWNTALDSSMIRDWLHKEISEDHPYYAHLVGYWQFNESSGSVAIDVSSKGNHGTLRADNSNMDTTSCWHKSAVPLATETTNDLYNLAAVWAGKDSAGSSIFSLKGTEIKDDGSVIFGHDNGELTWTENDVPSGLFVVNRLNRVWRIELYDTITTDLVFNTMDLGVNDGNQLYVLSDMDGGFSDADTLIGDYSEDSHLFTVPARGLQFGYYYTLGTSENLASLENSEQSGIPHIFKLYQNYPNPFNPITNIEFRIPDSEFVILNIYDVKGQVAKRLIGQELSAGVHRYQFDGSRLASGIYYYSLVFGDYRQVRKMILLR